MTSGSSEPPDGDPKPESERIPGNRSSHQQSSAKHGLSLAGLDRQQPGTQARVVQPRLSGMHLQLFGLIVAPFSLALLAIGIGGVMVHQEAMKGLIATRDVRGTRAAAAAIGQNLFHLESSLRIAAQRHQSAGQPLIDDVVLLKDFDAGYLVLNREGGALAASTPPPDWRGDLQFEAWPISNVTATELISHDGSTTVLLIAAERDVIAVGGFSLQNVARTARLSSMVSSDNSSVFVVDGQARLLYYAGDRPTEADLAAHPGVAEGLRGESGSTFREVDGIERVVAFAEIPDSGWALVVEESWKDVTSTVLDLSLMAPLALAPVLLITLLGLWFGARRVIRPLRELQEQAEQVAFTADSFEYSSTEGIAEIQQLRSSLADMAARIASTQQALKRYIGAITKAQEEERGRLARELHDDTIQGLIAIDHRIQMLIMEIEGRESELLEPLNDLHADVFRSITDLRRMTKALRPVFLEDLGLIPALKMLGDEFERDTDIDFSFQAAGDSRRLDPQVELAVYRIAQEALSNVAHHSGAGSAALSIELLNDRFLLTIQDDGEGFDTEMPSAKLATAGHFGLISMRERAALIEADLELTSSPTQGTLVRLRLDLQSDDERQNA